MKTQNLRNEKLQELCRGYLIALRSIAHKYGLLSWINETIQANIRGECESTEEEVELLSRIVDDERISRIDVPTILGKSYRQCFNDDDFGKVKKFKHVGIYSKVSALLLKKSQNE